jgi:ABC-2 type transport system ATP-binding protein
VSAAIAIELSDLHKRYGSVVALEGLSLSVNAGEVFGFLGPNGAGKTTTIRILLGLIHASSGRAAVLGRDVRDPSPAIRADIGYLPGELTFWPNRTGEETLQLLQGLTGRASTWRKEVLERLTFSASDLSRRVGTYSDGMRQKLGIVQALQCAPKLVLFDEPSKGLDPLVQQAFYELVLDLAHRGTTIFFSSHVLPEVERICQRVAMLRKGQLVSLSDVGELRKSLPRRVAIAFRDNVAPADFIAEFGPIAGASSARVELLVAANRIPALVARLATLSITDVTIEPPKLEDAFLERYK